MSQQLIASRETKALGKLKAAASNSLKIIDTQACRLRIHRLSLYIYFTNAHTICTKTWEPSHPHDVDATMETTATFRREKTHIYEALLTEVIGR